MCAISQCGKPKCEIWAKVSSIISNAAPDIYDSEREITNLRGKGEEKKKIIPQQIKS